MKTNHITLLLLIWAVNYTYGQTSAVSKAHIPSPEAYAMAQYAEIPVSLYTGVPSISIPVYTIQVGDYKLPISLNYHASGIKIAQEATRVGLGWSLSAGGSISRAIRGGDDDIDFFKRTAPIPEVKFEIKDGVMVYWLGNEDATAPTSLEPDQFYYNIRKLFRKILSEERRCPSQFFKRKVYGFQSGT